jgi:hypothetical protein
MAFTSLRIENCARCGETHDVVSCMKLTRPCEVNLKFTHWAQCPRTLEPILVSFEEVA